VVQGLSEVAAMRKFSRWGVLTIGTGLAMQASPPKRTSNLFQNGKATFIIRLRCSDVSPTSPI
jgi:hypothetical protein